MALKRIMMVMLLALAAGGRADAQYNTLRIPDTLVGTTFDLTARDTFCQMMPGNQTITASYNGDFWGPTMIWNKGDVVHINVHNQLADTTTVHWHGMHLPAIMDGGPHQTVPPYTTWSPYWQVTNHAGTYWYHPHLDMHAQEQLTEGLGGMIIIRDAVESALPLPRTYGVDDIPLALTDRRFSANQFVVWPYGDSIMANGTLRAQYTIPAQVVRFRLLGAAIETSYNIGFSDNRTFYVITTDGGLLDTSVGVTRFQLNAGERVEILVDCTGQSGTTLDMKAYNSEMSSAIPGGDAFGGGPFANALGHTNYTILHLLVGPATAAGITSIPHALTTNTFPSAASAVLTRTVTITDSNSTTIHTVPILGPTGFIINHHMFNIDTIDYHVPLDNTEVWQITSTSVFGHPFHIHDVEFYILSINGAPAPAYQQGWKDVVFVPAHAIVKFIAKFSDYSDALHPYMFHCHIAVHEDEGMMGQFVVGDAPGGIMNVAQNSKMKVFPNPTKGVLTFEMQDNIMIKQAAIINTHGQLMMQLDVAASSAELNVATLAHGLYFLRLTDEHGGSYIKSYLME